MRIAFLATPIIWMVGEGGKGAIVGAYLLFNPFYHFIEIFRAPLLGQTVDPISWVIVCVISILGLLFARFMHAHYSRYVALWI